MQWHQGRWCVAIPMADDALLQSIIDNACKRVDCSLIKYGGTCYEPNTLINHASVAMNLYFQATGRLESNCDFNNTGLIVISDPSSIIGSSASPLFLYFLISLVNWILILI